MGQWKSHAWHIVQHLVNVGQVPFYKVERVTNSEAANQMLARPMREPWDKVYQEYLV